MSKSIILLLFRFRFLFVHPVRSIRYFFSTNLDYSRIDILEIEKYAPTPELIIEAGAADGIDTMIFSRHFPRASIIAIEPVREQFNFLVEKFAKIPNVKLMNIALSNAQHQATIFVGEENGNLGGMGSSSLLEPTNHQKYFPSIKFPRTQTIQTLTLADLIVRNGDKVVDILWLDIQGKELDVLAASKDCLTSRVKLLHLEISRVNLYKGMPKERQLREFLRSVGFKCVIDKVGAISGNALYLNSKLIMKKD